MRINKLFSNYGICSRKETNRLIEEKRVKVNGEFCVLGQWVEIDKDKILLDDKPISIKKKVYIALNKPVGITCTAENKVKDNIIDFMKYPQYIFPVGRLDKESQGLIIMTNDGDLANEILESEHIHEKEYVVKVNKTFDDEFLKQMAKGVEISGNESSGIKRISDTLGVYKTENGEEVDLSRENLENLNTVQLKDFKQNNTTLKNTIRTRPCEISRINENTFRIILTQGLNKQIRKMSGALGYKVLKLERIRIMNINIVGIDVGKWRELNEEEVRNLKGEGDIF
ncbi:23S rRNA pseudouridine synthase F [Clostridium beijerinckii]|nr:23S rRNA pseudouridine synthase F [Clostridium beijerinckii]